MSRSYTLPTPGQRISLRDDSDIREFVTQRGIACDALDDETAAGIASGLGFKRDVDLCLYRAKSGKQACGVYVTTSGPGRGGFDKLMAVEGDAFTMTPEVAAGLANGIAAWVAQREAGNEAASQVAGNLA